jgi:hypothetical protein
MTPAVSVLDSRHELQLEGTLLEKLRKIDALLAGTKIDGEHEVIRPSTRGESGNRPSVEVISTRLDQINGHSCNTVGGNRVTRLVV